MKWMKALAAFAFGLSLLPVAVVAGDQESAEEESVERYGCGERVNKGTFEDVVRPRRVRYIRVMLSPRELREWGPIRATGTIGCDGRVHGLKIDKQLPEKVEAKLRKKVGKLRYKPATLAGEPVPVSYNLILKRPG